MNEKIPANPMTTQPPDIKSLLALVRTLVGEVNPHWKHLHFTPDTHLERELGLDSMSRMELRSRIETSLGVTLDVETAIGAGTPNDLLQAIGKQLEGTRPGGYWQQSAAASRQADASNLLMGSFEQTTVDKPVAPAAGHTPGEWLYAIYAWQVFILLGLISWVLVVFTPRASWRRKVAHLGARLFFTCTFTPLRVTGHEHLLHDRPQVVVANHTGYLDGFIITAALDIPIHFVVKGELSRIPPARIILERFGVEFVDRFNPHKGASTVRRIAEKSRNGQSLVFFPEGTFASFPGLQPFRMGAFVTATRSNVAVVPVAIKGARSIVRDRDWFPRRGKIEVTVRPPIMPEGEGWQVAIDLRDAARKEISRYCGEPDLVEDPDNT